MNIEACIFDMDGVIVDSAKYHFKAWQRLAEELGIEFTEAHNESLKGLSRVDSLEKILTIGDLEIDNDTKVALMEQKNAWYLEYISSMTPSEVLPGVKRFLEALQEEGIRIGLGSSSRNAKHILDAIQLSHFFTAVIDGNRVTYSKPDPEVFLMGARELGVNPNETVVFEDAQAGIAAARAGGFAVVGVGDPATLSAADAVIQGFSSFSPSHLKNLFNESMR
jgi:beta-phosphoglucomutase